VRSLRVLHAVACINEATGGTAVSVTGLAAALAAGGHRSSIVALDFPWLGRPRSAGGAEVHLERAPAASRRLGSFSPGLARQLTRGAGDSDVVHNHGVWLLPNRYARLASERAAVPLVISPRGMLDPWSRRRGRIKKLAAWHLYERSNIRAAAAFHATSDEEARSIRACGVRVPIAVIPNGVDVPACIDSLRSAELRARLPGGDKRYVLFLSRLHPKKGIELLLAAWRTVHDEQPNVHLLIAGGDEGGYRATLEEHASRLGVAASVTFTGPIDGELKAIAYANAHVFVLPSFSENFGIVVAEALAHGAPVIATKATPWEVAATHGCGWWIDVGAAPLVNALRSALAASEQERCDMAARARLLAHDRFAWGPIAKDMANFYQWICDDHCRPSTAPGFLAA
jgi:glycosyltransferase involved in cell wall biosynthesis